MRHQTTGLVLAALGALALTGCGDKTETKTTTTTTTATTATATATEGGAPVRKAGLWEQTTTAEGMGPMTSKICLGSNVAPACPGSKAVKTADGYAMTATCKTGGAAMTIEGAAKGDLSSAYTLTSKTTISDAGGKSQSMNATYSLRYLGPCPDGMTVGQIQSDEGAVVDMSHFDAAKARELAKQAGK
jgi:hypothetical protein